MLGTNVLVHFLKLDLHRLSLHVSSADFWNFSLLPRSVTDFVVKCQTPCICLLNISCPCQSTSRGQPVPDVDTFKIQWREKTLITGELEPIAWCLGRRGTKVTFCVVAKLLHMMLSETDSINLNAFLPDRTTQWSGCWSWKQICSTFPWQLTAFPSDVQPSAENICQVYKHSTHQKASWVSVGNKH